MTVLTRLIKTNGNRHYRYNAITIGSNVFIGINTIVLPDVSIGDNCIIGAGLLVTKVIPSNSFFAGNQAKYNSSFDGYASKVKKLNLIVNKAFLNIEIRLLSVCRITIVNNLI